MQPQRRRVCGRAGWAVSCHRVRTPQRCWAAGDSALAPWVRDKGHILLKYLKLLKHTSTNENKTFPCLVFNKYWLQKFIYLFFSFWSRCEIYFQNLKMISYTPILTTNKCGTYILNSIREEFTHIWIMGESYSSCLLILNKTDQVGHKY